jgi:hypothetical protein
MTVDKKARFRVIAIAGGVLLAVCFAALGFWAAMRFPDHGGHLAANGTMDMVTGVMVLGGSLVVLGTVLARTKPGGEPYLSAAMGLMVVGVALGRLAESHSGATAEALTLASGIAFGAEIGLFLAMWMQRRASRGKAE